MLPTVNQIELHPELQQAELRAWHAEHGIATEAWSPLAQGALLDDETIAHDRRPPRARRRPRRSCAGTCSSATSCIPKSVTPERVRENFDAVRLRAQRGRPRRDRPPRRRRPHRPRPRHLRGSVGNLAADGPKTGMAESAHRRWSPSTGGRCASAGCCERSGRSSRRRGRGPTPRRCDGCGGSTPSPRPPSSSAARCSRSGRRWRRPTSAGRCCRPASTWSAASSSAAAATRRCCR